MGSFNRYRHEWLFVLFVHEAWHFQITEEASIGNCLLPEPTSYLLDCVLQIFSGGSFCIIVEERELLGLILRDEIDSPDTYGADIVGPMIPLSKEIEACGGYFRWKLRLDRELTLILRSKEVVAPDIHLDASCRKLMKS